MMRTALLRRLMNVNHLPKIVCLFFFPLKVITPFNVVETAESVPSDQSSPTHTTGDEGTSLRKRRSRKHKQHRAKRGAGSLPLLFDGDDNTTKKSHHQSKFDYCCYSFIFSN